MYHLGFLLTTYYMYIQHLAFYNSPPNQVHRYMCINKNVNKWNWLINWMIEINP